MEPPRPNFLRRWRDVQRQLDEAIRCYVQRAADIEAAVSNPTHFTDLHLLESTILEAHQDSHSLPSRADQLMKAKATLNQVRNGLTSLAPIKKLPSEVLLQIFHIVWHKSCTLCDSSLVDPSRSLHRHNPSMPPYILAHVCKYWRTIIINTSSAWSHAGLTLSFYKNLVKSCDRVQVFLQRAHNSPSCVWVDSNNTMTDEGVDLATSCLKPHLSKLESLSLVNSCYCSGILKLISFWLTHGRAGSVRTLTVWLGDTDDHHGWRLYSSNRALGRQHLDSFLSPICVLRLNGVYFDWNSSVYHNLEVLQLGNLRRGFSPTLRQLLAVLSACPRLHSLQLLDMSIVADNNEATPLSPAILLQLRYLDMRRVSPLGTSLLLPRIVPRTRLRVRIDIYPTFIDAAAIVRRFLSRADLTGIYLSDLHTADDLTEYLSAVPNVDTLILDLSEKPEASNDILAALTHTSESSTARVPLCAKIHTLYILGGLIGLSMLQQVVEAHPSLRNLRLISCVCDDGLSVAEVLSRLQPLVKDIRCGTDEVPIQW